MRRGTPAKFVGCGPPAAFLAGIVLACLPAYAQCPPEILGEPIPASACATGTALYIVTVNGSGLLAYRWEIATGPGEWMVLGTDPLQLPCGGWAAALSPSSAACDIGVYPCAGVGQYLVRAIISNACGSVESAPAVHTIIYPPSVEHTPSPASACPNGGAEFSVGAEDGVSAYEWQWRDPDIPGAAWTNIVAGPNLHFGELAFDADGQWSTLLTLDRIAPPADGCEFRCFVYNVCGRTPTGAAPLTICAADFNCDGAPNSQDVFDFLSAFFAGEARADFSGDGTVDSQDFFDFLSGFFAGCP